MFAQVTAKNSGCFF